MHIYDRLWHLLSLQLKYAYGKSNVIQLCMYHKFLRSQLRWSGWPRKATVDRCTPFYLEGWGKIVSTDWSPQKFATDGWKMVALMEILPVLDSVLQLVSSKEFKLQSVVTHLQAIVYWACTEIICVLCTCAALSSKQMQTPLLGRLQPILLTALSPLLSR